MAKRRRQNVNAEAERILLEIHRYSGPSLPLYHLIEELSNSLDINDFSSLTEAEQYLYATLLYYGDVLLQLTKRRGTRFLLRGKWALAYVFIVRFALSNRLRPLYDAEQLPEYFADHVRYLANTHVAPRRSRKKYMMPHKQRPLPLERFLELLDGHPLTTVEIKEVCRVRIRAPQKWIKSGKLLARGPNRTVLREDFLKWCFAQEKPKYFLIAEKFEEYKKKGKIT